MRFGIKRVFIPIFAALLLLSSLAGCGQGSVKTNPPTPRPGGETARESTKETSPAPATPTPETPDVPTPTTPETPDVPTPTTPDHTAAPEEGSWLLHETPDAGKTYQNQLVFLGDSTTAHMIYRGGLYGGENTTQVWRGESNTITFKYIETAKILYPQTGEYIPIKDAVAASKPDFLVITLGVTGGVSNDISEESFKTLYAWLLDTVLNASLKTTVIVQSIYPVNKVNSYKKTVTNDKILVYNEYIKAVVRDFHSAGRKVFYADTYSALLDEEGYLKEEYGNGDGLHISAEGYEEILHYLRTHAVVLQ